MKDETRIDRVEKQINGVMIVLAITIAVLLAVLWGIVPVAHAQNPTFCNPMGSMTSCLDQRGNMTTITPLGAGISSWSNNHGQSGTIVQPLPTPQVQPFQYGATSQPFGQPAPSPPSRPVLPWSR